MPASVSSRTVAPSARAASSPGSRACSTDSWKVTTRPVKVTPRSDGEPVQAPGVLDGEDVGRGHHLAQPRPDVAGLAQGCPAQHQPSTHATEPVTAGRHRRPACRVPARACEGRGQAGPVTTLAAWRCWLPSGRTRGPRARRPSCRGGRSRAPGATSSRRCRPTAGCPGCSAAALGLISLVSPAVGHQLPGRAAVRRGLLPARGRASCCLWGHEYNRGYSFIVHPPLGKWFIAVGEQLFGYNSFGWRFPSAVAGAVAVVVLARLARRLTGSTLLGLVAGLLLALDGFSFTLVADRAARRLPAGARGERGGLPGRRPRRRPRPDRRGRRRRNRVPARSARLADRRRGSCSAAPAR